MTTAHIKKQVDNYLPLLSDKQQLLVLEMIMGLLHIDEKQDRITKKQYNKETDEAVLRIEKGEYTNHEDAVKELSKW
jgi:hypothetical protein